MLRWCADDDLCTEGGAENLDVACEGEVNNEEVGGASAFLVLDA